MQRRFHSRRDVLTGGAALLAAPAILRTTRAYASTPTLKVGHVSPRTGPLAGFAEADENGTLAGFYKFSKATIARGSKFPIEEFGGARHSTETVNSVSVDGSARSSTGIEGWKEVNLSPYVN